MKWTLVAGFACGAALVLGACSSSGTPGTSSNGSGMNTGGTNMPPTTDEPDPTPTPEVPTVLRPADASYDAADTAVTAAERAVVAADDATGTARDAARVNARNLITAALAAIDKAVMDATAAQTEVTDPDNIDDYTNEVLGQAGEFVTRANMLNTGRGAALRASLNQFSWFGTKLVRYTFSASDVDEPNDGATDITILRTPRTKNTSATNTAQIANTGDNVITANKFKAVMYSSGDKVFSNSGDEFKVDGYVAHADGWPNFDRGLQTGLKITNSGLEIRTGGSRPAASGVTGQTEYDTDYLDMRKKLNARIEATAGVANRGNGWDLKITFREPVFNRDRSTNWYGNGDFYWRGIVDKDTTQSGTDTSKTNYVANTFTQVSQANKNLGIYELWLSNNIDVDKKLEPSTGSTGTVLCADGNPSSETGNACPDDDVDYHLEYAAYGLFLYTADPRALGTSSFSDPSQGANYLNVVGSRVQSMHFGYAAFADSNGQRTRDIGESIENATFRGRTIARAFTGTISGDGSTSTVSPTVASNRFLRGDVSLTVNIGKGTTGTSNIKGEMTNFEEWDGANGVWVTYPSGFKVTLDDGMATPGPVTIGLGGTFEGTAKFAQVDGPAVGRHPTLRPTLTPATGAAGSGVAGAIYGGGSAGTGGKFKGSFYGDRSNKATLEAAGSWGMGPMETTSGNSNHWYNVVGSFGAKQRPAADN